MTDYLKQLWGINKLPEYTIPRPKLPEGNGFNSKLCHG